MKLLVLGGTIFVGRHFVEAAAKAGHRITLLHRGQTAPGLFPRLENVLGDRRKDLAKLGDGPWDAVVDFCGYHSAEVRETAEYFGRRTGRYVFISTVSVYRDRGAGRLDEAAALLDPIESEGGAFVAESYGGRKVACERAARDAFGERALIVRPGLVVGPFDPTDRFTYWPSRVARGGKTLAPGDPERRVQFIDARDLAEWTVRAIESGLQGAYNANGAGVSMREILDTCRAATAGDATFAWVADAVLEKAGVQPYTELPLWIPGQHDSFDSSAAVRRGLRYRPLRDTVLDTWRWDQTRAAGAPRRNGLPPQREAQLLGASS